MSSSSTPIEYRTSDLIVATILAYHDFKLIRVERASQNKSIFIFEENEERRQKILTDLMNNELKVNPQKYEACKKRLKTYLLNF